jgi:hypothetical protein
VTRRTITEEEAQAWRYRGNAARPMTDREAREWDVAQRTGDRATILRIKRACNGVPEGGYGRGRAK